MMDSILNEYVWEFAFNKVDSNQLILKKIHHVDSQSFTDIECIEQWNFVIPETFLQYTDYNKILDIRKGNKDFKAYIRNNKVYIE